MTDQTKRLIAVFTGATLAALALTVALAELRFMPVDQGLDGYYYARMATKYPADLLIAPFQQRVLVPLVVAVLPLPVTWGFAIVSSLLLGVTATAMYRLLDRLFTARVAWIGLGLLGVSGAVNMILATPYSADGIVTGSDWSRMFLPAMPVVIGLACAAMSPAGKQTAEPAHQEMMQ